MKRSETVHFPSDLPKLKRKKTLQIDNEVIIDFDKPIGQ